MILSRILILLAVSFLPLSGAFRVARKFGTQQYRTAPPILLDRIRTVIKSRLGIGTDATEALVKAIFERDGVERLEGGIFRLKSKKQIGDLVEIRGLQQLDRALEQGRGCIMYSGHFRGRWSFFAKLGLLGYRPLVIRQNPPPNMSRTFYWFQDRFDNLFSTKFDCQFLWVESPNRTVVVKAAAHLRKNGVLVNLIDISSYANRVAEVNFLNKKEQFPTGTVLLSQITHAPLLGFSIHYSAEQTRYVCEFGPAHVASEDALASTQQLATQIEASIVSHPEDWAGWQKSQYLDK